MSNARLQQLMTLSLMGWALAWAAAWGYHGRWAMAAWALALLVAHVPALALELLWASRLTLQASARRTWGDSQAPVQPYPSLAQWVQAGWQETLLGLRVFAWHQPWRHRAHADHLPFEARGRRGVLLVHGFYCNRGFWNAWMPRLRQAGVPFVAITLEPPQADIARQARGLDQARQKLIEATGIEPLLVGHSMGGLAIRNWLAAQSDDLARRQEVITIGSPHHGTALAAWAHSPAALQMRMGSDFLRSLQARDSAASLSRMTCYWSVCDNVVFPPNSATLAGARNIHLPGLPHVGLAMAAPILDDVLERLGGQAGMRPQG
ncbi:MAG: alpha/beta fold hydrolase [Betaproteobacteria bacterium]